jgi:AcrR family transcriptional regulator
MSTKQYSVKERIIETASRLFYTQGYNLTGVNQIIAEAEVAKASLFQHFPTKEDLCVAYLSRKSEKWFAQLNDFTQKAAGGKDKAVLAFDFLADASPKENFRGCSFLNILSEVPQDNEKILAEVRKNKNQLRNLFQLWLAETDKADIAYLLFDGAIIESQVHQSVWPIHTAKHALSLTS